MRALKIFLSSLLFCGTMFIGCKDSASEPKPPLETSTRQQIMVVLDASLPMSEQGHNGVKYDVMRDEFGRMVKTWQDQEIDAGVVVFGHQNQNDCADIELIDRPRPVDAVTLGRIAYGLSPKGQAPLSEAVWVAAKHLNITKGPSKIIAITHGQDTCGYDPCLLKDELKDIGIELDVHNVNDGSQILHCGIISEQTVAPAADSDDYNEAQGGLQIQALRHDTGEPMWPMTWILHGPDNAVYELIDDDPSLDLSRLQATELRGGDYTITGFSGDYAGSSNFTLGPSLPEKNVLYVILYADVPHTEGE